MRVRIRGEIYYIVAWIPVTYTKWFKTYTDIYIYCRDGKYNSVKFLASEIERYE